MEGTGGEVKLMEATGGGGGAKADRIYEMGM